MLDSVQIVKHPAFDGVKEYGHSASVWILLIVWLSGVHYEDYHRHLQRN